MADEIEVQFTVKELFQQIQQDTKEIKASLALKADASRVNGIDKCLRDMLSEGSPQSQKNARDIEKINGKLDKLSWKVAGIAGSISTIILLAKMAIDFASHR